MMSILTVTPQPALSQEPEEPILWGAYVQPRSGQTQQSAVEAFEAMVGRKLGAVRVYDLWNTAFPNSFTTWLRDSGHTVVLSVKPRRTNGTIILWRDIANAAQGTTLYNEIVAWADAVKAFDAPLYFIFHHEPEAAGNLPYGTATEFIAAWRKIVTVFGQQGVTNARYLWTMTDYSFAVSPSDRRSAPKWYPGDGYVHGIAADPYNWYTCRSDNPIPWMSLQQNLEPMRQFGAAHPAEELWLSEFGSVEDAVQAGRKGQWIETARQLFKSPGWEQYRGVLYFHNEHAVGSPCQWWVDTSTSAQNAFKAMGADPYYRGGLPEGPANVLFVVADPAALGTGDAAVRTRLLGAGYEVTTMDDDAVTAADGANADTVVLSSTISSSRAGIFTSVATPLVSWKPWSYDPLDLTGPTANADYGNASASTLAFPNAQHPLAAGLSGTVAITSSPQTIGWGVPATSADVVATVTGKPGLFAYRAGDPLVGGAPAPACRVGFPSGHIAPSVFTASGWLLFDRAVQWTVTGCP